MILFSDPTELSLIQKIIEGIAEVVEITGVAVILIGLICAVFRHIRETKSICFCKENGDYRQLRRELGRSLLLGLEFLVAGDIIHTVAVQPSMNNLAVLGALVVLRFFLSVALELEIDGRWPWQKPDKDEFN